MGVVTWEYPIMLRHMQLVEQTLHTHQYEFYLHLLLPCTADKQSCQINDLCNCPVVYCKVYYDSPCGMVDFENLFWTIVIVVLSCESAKRCIFGQLHLSRGWQPQTRPDPGPAQLPDVATASFSRSIGGVASRGCLCVCVYVAYLCLLCCHATTTRRRKCASVFGACN